MNYYKEYLENKRHLSEYSIDGAINQEIWKNVFPKLLFILKENWGYQGCGIFNTSKHAHKWLDATNTKTYKKITILSACVHNAVNKRKPLTESEICEIGNHSNLLHETLDKIAVINIKKHSGNSISNDREIRQESLENSDLLRRQILELKPSVIIAGSNVCWDSLVLDLKLFRDKPVCPKHQAVQHEGYTLCFTNHPSAWSGGGFPILSLHKEILDHLK